MQNNYKTSQLIFLDTETTGLDYNEDRIIQLACLKIDEMDYDGCWLKNMRYWDSYFNVDTIISSQAFDVHGISSAFLKNKPKFTEKASELLDFIKNYTIVAHNAQFDINFLNHEFKIAKYPSICNTIIDSVDIAKVLYPGQSVALDALMKKFGMTSRGKHSAVEDALMLAKVYFMMITNTVSSQIYEDHSDDFSGYKFCETVIEKV